eukprot:COSAG01_NODE_5401_length_4294_cov_154.339226_2_plen_131_part_00
MEPIGGAASAEYDLTASSGSDDDVDSTAAEDFTSTAQLMRLPNDVDLVFPEGIVPDAVRLVMFLEAGIGHAPADDPFVVLQQRTRLAAALAAPVRGLAPGEVWPWFDGVVGDPVVTLKIQGGRCGRTQLM